jgi:hypothetical protein
MNLPRGSRGVEYPLIIPGSSQKHRVHQAARRQSVARSLFQEFGRSEAFFQGIISVFRNSKNSGRRPASNC